MVDDVKTYPVQGGGHVPEWLVQEAFAEYARAYLHSRSFEDLHERGGFGRDELLDLLAGGTGDGTVLKRMRAGRERDPLAARKAVLAAALRFAAEATADPVKQEAMALLIIKAASHFCQEGHRPRDIERATMALTKADLP